MSDDIFDNRFFSTRPEWHGKGLIDSKPSTAVDAWGRVTPYSMRLDDLYYENVDGLAPSGFRAIIREPIPDDPMNRVFGIVGRDYVLIDPQEICEIFDEAVKAPVQTLGVLGRGETLFITTLLPDMNIKGDHIETYLDVVSPYQGNAALQAMVTPVRVVCRNTLRAATSAATETYRIPHDPLAQRRLKAWMSGMMNRAIIRTQTLSQAFEMFASYTPSVKTVGNIIEKVYSLPEAPSELEASDVDLYSQRVKSYEETVRSLTRSRQAVHELFDGRGTGMDIQACKGTGWGLYNSFAEWENWRRTTKSGSREESVLVGDRGTVIKKAYSVVFDHAERVSNR